ncbi:MAG: hypothetical protein HOV97_04955 [Nonomuraea sp.]|nr:hypothetical protein [Nonomuraea sp.]
MTVQTQEKLLSLMTAEVYEVNQANGWFDDNREFDDDVALLHSEVSEMFEAYRDHGYEDVTAQGCPSQDFEGHLCKPQGFGSECADVLIRLLDTSFRQGMTFLWDTLAEVGDYENFDPYRSIGGHISRLHALIARIQPGTSLNPTLAYLVTWCRNLGIDLQGEYDRKLAFNATRGHKHGGKRI